ncbi:MAG: ribosome small subunit-dependent GTPase A [Anaerolineae bacterium]|nr:ribosome small subunit-dependent GTPase A [Anaerolineae bacterium]MDK1081169.1 ribosome small subunit-dependent GTPase A [Anaerolineae bacterium]
MTESTIPGLIIRAQSGFLTVETEQGAVVCQLRGRLKRGPRTGDLTAIGDRVQITVLADGSGMIEQIEERKQAIIRLDPRPQGEYRQILLANADQAVFVFACKRPDPRLKMLDRFLVIAEKQGIPSVIVANKVDLVGSKKAKEIFGLYADIGYPIIYTSATDKKGVDKLQSTLIGKISALAGPSGAGKSSLLNAIQPGLGLEVDEVSEALNKGVHTTVVRQMFPLAGGGYVADTPGWKSLALWDTEPEEIDGYFPELRERVADCQFNDCSHIHEPGCSVLAAVERGEVHPERYASYLRLRAGQK